MSNTLGGTQGKCEPCKKLYVWTGVPLLRVALCPTCERPLARTTHLRQLPRVYETPIDGSVPRP